MKNIFKKYDSLIKTYLHHNNYRFCVLLYLIVKPIPDICLGAATDIYKCSSISVCKEADSGEEGSHTLIVTCSAFIVVLPIILSSSSCLSSPSFCPRHLFCPRHHFCPPYHFVLVIIFVLANVFVIMAIFDKTDFWGLTYP